MPSIINASTSSTGLVQSADASGILQLQANGTTGVTVGSGGVVTLANGAIFSNMTLGTAIAGEFEYDGRVPYFTPAGTQRGVVPGMQYYALSTAVVGANATGAQSTLGVGVTLSSSTIYAFESVITLAKTAGTTSHTLSTLFGGTATVNNIGYTVSEVDNNNAVNQRASGGTGASVSMTYINQTSAVVVTNTMSVATQIVLMNIKGVVSVNTGGTFIPQYSLSAQPGGAYTTAVGSYFLIYPISASGSNTSIGTWA